MNDKNTSHGPLGRNVSYSDSYDPAQLFPISRETARVQMALEEAAPFYGIDIWNAYEFSWLDSRGLPHVAVAQINIDAGSKNIVESKSVKLYLNSFNQSRFATVKDVESSLCSDLAEVVQGRVEVSLILPHRFASGSFDTPEGFFLDSQPITIDTYTPRPEYLEVGANFVKEQLYSNLLRTKCPVTGQPDWATVLISYKGQEIIKENLLRYIVSFREHTGFHENCVEHIFMDIQRRCHPDELTVRAQFTRRGGIDINPIRTTVKQQMNNMRLFRQ